MNEHQKRPNIIVFMTDQQNAQTILPSSQAITPNIEKFYKNAVHFDRSYTVSPHCCPSRASFFTGKYPSEHGVWNNVEVDNAISRGVYDDITMFPERLKEVGYNTYFSGKWHVSALEGPEDRGFDNVLREYISNYGRMEKGYVPKYNEWMHVYNGQVPIDGQNETKNFGRILREGYPTYYQFGLEENPFGDTTTVEKACKTIREYNDEEPFFMYVGTVGPHDPYNPPKEFLDLYENIEIELPINFEDTLEGKPNLYKRTKERLDLTKEEHMESLRRYYAFCSYEDHLFGELLQEVKHKGIFENTLIIYMTDHGDYASAHGLWAKGLPCFDEAYRLCTVVGGNGIKGNRTVSQMVAITDLAPTILEYAGVTIKDEYSGSSIKPFLDGEPPKYWRTEMYTQTNGNEIYGIQRAVWDNQYKYVFNTFDYDELYDLEHDPFEMNNIISKEGSEAIIKKMCMKMWQFAFLTKDNNTCPYILTSLAPYGPGIILKG